MPKFYILYRGDLTGRSPHFTTETDANTEQEARTAFEEVYPYATLVKIRKGRPFTKADISKAKKIAL